MTRKVEQKLDAMYADMPNVDCKGYCAEACGPISMTKDEWRRLREYSGIEPTVRESDGHCVYLTKDGRCSVHSVRPTICRIFGLSKGLPCPWGCVPDRWLTREEGFRFLERSRKITGRGLFKPTGRITPESIREMVEKLLGSEDSPP